MDGAKAGGFVGVALTGKQAAFVEAYLIHRNATRAAIEAGYDGDYNSCAVIGHENLKKVNIAEAISARITESCMSADEVLERLGAQARGDVKEFLSTQADGTPFFDYGGALAEGKTHLIKKMKTKRRIYTEKGKEDTPIVETEVEFELHDAQAALVHIGRHHKLFTDKQEVSGPDAGPIPFTVDIIDQAKDELAEWKQRKKEQKSS